MRFGPAALLTADSAKSLRLGGTNEIGVRYRDCLQLELAALADRVRAAPSSTLQIDYASSLESAFMRAAQSAFIGSAHPLQATIDRFLDFDNKLTRFGLIANLSHLGLPAPLLHRLMNVGPESRRRELIDIWQRWIASPE